MTELRIFVQCKEDDNHAKILRINAGLGREYAETLAGLLDGTSKFYIFPPGDLSPIGRCGLCHGKIEATVEEVETSAPKRRNANEGSGDAKPKRK